MPFICANPLYSSLHRLKRKNRLSLGGSMTPVTGFALRDLKKDDFLFIYVKPKLPHHLSM